MPEGEAKVEKTMHEFKEGTLHSGSKEGPKVTDRDQAIAIALKQAGLSKYEHEEVPEDVEPEEYARIHQHFARKYPHFHAAYMKHCGV